MTGLDYGSMDLNGIGYSNIRLPNDNASYIYTYNPYINTFPEEVFIHEFLHTLERNLNERGYSIPALHDNKKYGYTEKSLIGLKEWYGDYLTKNIRNGNGEQVGLEKEVFSTTPPAESDFKYCVEKDFSKEPQNFIEEIRALIANIGKLF